MDAPTPHRSKRSRTFRAGCFALYLVGLVLSLELVLTVGSALFYPRRTISDARYGWRYRHTEHPVERRWAADPDAVYRIYINREGFRDDEFSTDPDELRLMVLGDSMTFGMEADQDEIYPQVLERALRQSLGTSKIDVMNLGVTGFGTAQQLLVLQDYAPRFLPDAVLLMMFEHNDFEDNANVFGARFRPHYVLRDGALVLENRPTAWQRAQNFLRDHSVLFYLLSNVIPLTREHMRSDLPLDDAEKTRLTLRILGEMVDFNARHGIPFYVFYARLPEDSPRRMPLVRDFLSERQVPFTVITAEPSQRVQGIGHWNKEGHAAAARIVLERLAADPAWRQKVRLKLGRGADTAAGSVLEPVQVEPGLASSLAPGVAAESTPHLVQPGRTGALQ